MKVSVSNSPDHKRVAFEKYQRELNTLALNLASIWAHGDWKAETPMERELEGQMRTLGFWPLTPEQVVAMREKQEKM